MNTPSMKTRSQSVNTADSRRRRRLTRLFTLMVWMGVMLAAIPFVDSLLGNNAGSMADPNTRVDLHALAPGEARRVQWQGQVLWVLHRSAAQIKALVGRERSVDPRFFVAYAQPGYAGCPLEYRDAHDGPANRIGWLGGFVEPCEGAWYDAAGHVLPGSPASARDLPVPPSRLDGDQVLVIGAGAVGHDMGQTQVAK